MVGVPGDEQIRTDESGFPDQPHVRRRAAGRAGGPRRAGLRGRGGGVQPVRVPLALRRDLEPVGRGRPCKDSLFCPTTEEYILPIIHGNDRVEWFVQLSDEIGWEVEDRDTGAPRAKVMMKAGDVACDAGRHPPPGLLAQALDAPRVGERRPELPELLSSGQGSGCRRSTSRPDARDQPARARRRENRVVQTKLVHRRRVRRRRSTARRIEVLNPHDGVEDRRRRRGQAGRRRPRGRRGPRGLPGVERRPRPPSAAGCCCGSPTPSRPTPTSWRTLESDRHRPSDQGLVAARRAADGGDASATSAAWPTSSRAT